MSTFGKKALAWWDYQDKSRDSVRRYNFTPDDMQLQILEKWYPIGFKFKENGYLLNGVKMWEVVDYKRNVGGCWLLELKCISNELPNILKHPLATGMTTQSEKSVKREIKLNKILYGNS